MRNPRPPAHLPSRIRAVTPLVTYLYIRSRSMRDSFFGSSLQTSWGTTMVIFPGGNVSPGAAPLRFLLLAPALP